MNTSLIKNPTQQSNEQVNQLDEVLYFNPKSEERLIKALSNNRKFEFLMFNLWRTRAVLFNILQDNYDKESKSYLNNVEEKFGNQFHAINDLIGVLLEGTDFHPSIFPQEPTERF
ncbi:hypothetical protein [Empedobacter falsenii]|uniref:Uncharacterized protein n=1 Tax=Empedobacter falsenii TaxID=343874 RepID=A0A3R8SJL2_9FLAO|nr:hypothetical protein [Empedobacter falsenii]RRT86454.1 hypothetical protein EGI88_14565 [Empedobacter falsenii]RRT87513.1 hypothetical protein EGI89_14510 [Empedobacter falsenii]